MVRPSNPLLMSAILNAVARLAEGKGSTVRDILKYVQQNSNGRSRNLTMQVHRALKHAVNAGLLRHRSGRYKVLISVNPISAPQSLPEDSKSGDDIADKVPNGKTVRPKKRVKDTAKQQNNKRPSRKGIRSKSVQQQCTHHRKHVEPVSKDGKVMRKQQVKPNNKIMDCCDWMRPIVDVRSKRVTKRKKTPEILEENEEEDEDDEEEDEEEKEDEDEMEVDHSLSSDRSQDQICASASDVSDDSTCEKSSKPRSKFYSHGRRRVLTPVRKRSMLPQETRGQGSKAKLRKRSTSRNRSPQRSNYNLNQEQQHHHHHQQQLQQQQQLQYQQQQQQQQQLQIQELPNDNLDDVRMDCEQVSPNVESNDEPVNQDTDRTYKVNNSGSGSSLEN